MVMRMTQFFTPFFVAVLLELFSLVWESLKFLTFQGWFLFWVKKWNKNKNRFYFIWISILTSLDLLWQTRNVVVWKGLKANPLPEKLLIPFPLYALARSVIVFHDLWRFRLRAFRIQYFSLDFSSSRHHSTRCFKSSSFGSLCTP